MLPPAATAAASFQPSLPAAATPVRLDAFQPLGNPPGGGPGIGQAISDAMNSFGARAAQMQAGVQQLAMQDAAAGRAPAAGQVPSLQPSGAEGAPPAQGPMALMVDSFNFAIEASLVSRAATQFTSSISTLMKGQ